MPLDACCSACASNVDCTGFTVHRGLCNFFQGAVTPVHKVGACTYVPRFLEPPSPPPSPPPTPPSLGSGGGVFGAVFPPPASPPAPPSTRRRLEPFWKLQTVLENLAPASSAGAAVRISTTSVGSPAARERRLSDDGADDGTATCTELVTVEIIQPIDATCSGAGVGCKLGALALEMLTTTIDVLHAVSCPGNTNVNVSVSCLLYTSPSPRDS